MEEQRARYVAVSRWVERREEMVWEVSRIDGPTDPAEVIEAFIELSKTPMDGDVEE
jgi:hypothetical protein